MPTKIVLTTEEELSEQEVADLQYLLTDAVGEFTSRRSPPELYVIKRYGEGVAAPYHNKDLLSKMEQVGRRVALAKKLHNATLHPVTVNIGPGLTETALDEMAAADSRDEACMVFLQEVFGMSEEEAQGTFNQLEDKRISRLMAAQGLVTS